MGVTEAVAVGKGADEVGDGGRFAGGEVIGHERHFPAVFALQVFSQVHKDADEGAALVGGESGVTGPNLGCLDYPSGQGFFPEEAEGGFPGNHDFGQGGVIVGAGGPPQTAGVGEQS